MLAVFAQDAELARRVSACLEPFGGAEVIEEWGRLREHVHGSGPVVVAAPDPSRELLARVQALKRRHPAVPFVLVARRNPDALRGLKNVVIEEVVWADGLEDELALALLRADGERRLRERGTRLREAPHLAPTLVSALARALCRRPPLTSVRALAAEIDRDRRTVWHYWREAFEDGDLTPKGFLDWVLLLRARTSRTAGAKWGRVADDLGVHTRTLRRVAERRLGASLDELAARDVDELFAAFDREVVGPLLAADEGGAAG